MPYNGSGTFSRIYSWVNDAAANIKIRADRMDNEMNGMAVGLSTCITKDGQTTVTANLPMAGFRHTGVGNATARNQYASFAQAQDGVVAWADGGGTADAITANYPITITTLVDGQLCYVRATAANATTTPTFSPNALTARTIVKLGGLPLAVGDIVGDGHELILRYDLANTRWELLNAGGGIADGSITGAKLANGAVDLAGAKVTGVLPVANGGTGGLFGGRNLIINGQFAINQRSASSVADDVYGFDRWYALTQTAALTVSAQTNQENGQPTNIRLTQPQVTAQRIGHAQIVQSLNCRHLRGGNAVLSGRIRCSVSQPIRFAILSWTGTADSVTSDVVNNWTSGTFTTGNFFNSTTLEVVATGAVTPSANTWTDLSVTGAVSASMNNLIVMAWTEGTLVQNGTLDLGIIQLESGTTKSAFEYVPSDEELLRCQYYLPVIVGSTSTHMLAICQAYNTSTVVASVQFPTNVRNRPTGVTASALSDFGVWNSAGAVADANAITFVSASFNNAYLEISRTGSGLTAGDASGFVSQNSNASLIFTGCEL